jgi:uncharacterized membrane protein YecN with MAPEG domain
MPLIPVTATYASLLAILVVIEILVVVKLRTSLKVGMGDGGNRDLQRAIRVHGNAIETIPLVLILLAAYELNHGGAAVLHIAGAVFLLSRVLHAWGLYSSGGASPGRLAGMVGSVTAVLVLAVANLLKVLGS